LRLCTSILSRGSDIFAGTTLRFAHEKYDSVVLSHANKFGVINAQLRNMMSLNFILPFNARLIEQIYVGGFFAAFSLQKR
jgi:hypothetical protein